MNITEAAQSLLTGKGVYPGIPYFMQADGSLTDIYGKMIIPANDALKKAFESFDGVVSVVPIASTTLGGVKGVAKGIGDTVQVKIDAAGAMYVPTYPAASILNNYTTPIQEVASDAPVLLVEGSFWAADDALNVLTDGEWVEDTNYVVSETEPTLLVEGSFWASTTALNVLTSGEWVEEENYTASEDEPTEPTTGDYWLKPSTGILNVYGASSFAEVSETYVVSETEPTVHADGDHWYDETSSLLKVLDTTWGEVSETYVYSATEPHIYAEEERYGNTADKKIYIVTEGAWVEETGKTGWFYYTADKVYTWTAESGMVAI